MTNFGSNYHTYQITREEQILYAYLLERVKLEPPEELIKDFRCLFIDGVSCFNPQVRQSLERIITSHSADREFKFIINRSCHILINRWREQPQFQWAIPQLLSLFEAEPVELSSSATTKRLHSLVEDFKKTEQYSKLQQLTKAITEKAEGSYRAETKPLKSLIRRYPCLYEHYLLNKNSTEEQKRKVRLIKAKAQWQFQIDLSKYITYQKLLNSRQSTQQKAYNYSQQELLNLQSGNNPTLLSDQQLNIALRHFLGKVDGSNTHRDLASQFLTHNQTNNYRTFKRDLYDYLITSIDSRYGKGQFNRLLCEHLNNSMPEQDSQPLNEMLLVGTCRKLLDFLVVESSQKPTHYIFFDLTGNLGITATIGLLLKIVLISRQVKPYLEKRFTILFNHYQGCSKDNVGWLVESLENVNVALSTHFGVMKHSY